MTVLDYSDKPKRLRSGAERPLPAPSPSRVSFDIKLTSVNRKTRVTTSKLSQCFLVCTSSVCVCVSLDLRIFSLKILILLEK